MKSSITSTKGSPSFFCLHLPKGFGDLADEGNDGSSKSGEAQEAKRATHGK